MLLKAWMLALDKCKSKLSWGSGSKPYLITLSLFAWREFENHSQLKNQVIKILYSFKIQFPINLIQIFLYNIK